MLAIVVDDDVNLFDVPLDKVHDVFEVALHQEGLDPNVGNILNLLARKVSPAEFGFQTVRHLSDLAKKLKDPKHTHNTLQATWKVNGKNVIFSDVFNDLHNFVDLIRQRVEKVIEEKAVDRTVAGVLIDSKVVVPSISGVPVVYKIDDNFLSNINGKVKSEPNKKNLILNHSAVFSLKTSALMVLSNNKVGYDYEAKLAVTPILDVDVEKRDTGAVLRFNLPEGVEKHTLIKFKQSLKEVKHDGKTDSHVENELAVEPRSENCFAPLSKYHQSSSL